MRWSIIRLIWLRELRDQLRDRRTLFMIAGLPLLLYPVLGCAVLQFAVGFVERPSLVGVVRGPDPGRDFPLPFLLGLALGVLAVRSASLLPGVLLHLGCFVLLVAGGRLERDGAASVGLSEAGLLAVRLIAAAVCTALAVLLLWWLNWRGTARTPLQALVGLPAAAAQIALDLLARSLLYPT